MNCLESGLSEKRPRNDLALGSTVKCSAKQAVWQNVVMEF